MSKLVGQSDKLNRLKGVISEKLFSQRLSSICRNPSIDKGNQ